MVARGIVQDIDPNTKFGTRRLEERNFKVHMNVVYDGGVILPLPHDDWKSKLGEVAQGSVIWPKELLMFGDYGTEGSSGSDDNSTEGKDRKVDGLTAYGGNANATPSMALGVSTVPASLTFKQVQNVPYSNGKARGISVTPPTLVAEVPSQHGLASGQLTMV
ncbi:hypothetical protein IFM89_025349 [Coptis chinensis]|uniref:DUF8039 domain-containing protein n=1 Tax=Coptis chinensis TaxID=261450 RepID=A0A835HY06_9MAGN|nr:hypothetical protein IFM89_025349 [Coptis chinensis]